PAGGDEAARPLSCRAKAAARTHERHRRLYGPLFRSTHIAANDASSSANARAADPDHDAVDRHRAIRGVAVSVAVTLGADGGCGVVPAPLHRRWLRRRAGATEVSGVTGRRPPRFLGR